MAPTRRASGNAQDQNTVAGNRSKRKRHGTSNLQPNSVPKKRKGNKSIDVIPDKSTDSQKLVADEKVIKEFRITFHPQKYCPKRPGNVPEQHQTKFQHIQQLGRMSYESYAVQPRPDITNKPWELENKERAKRVSQKAARARSDLQNEDGWRMALENHIFERFEIEVAWYDELRAQFASDLVC